MGRALLRSRWRPFIAALALACTACSEPVVLEQARFDLNCPDDKIEITTLRSSRLFARHGVFRWRAPSATEYGAYLAAGCGRRNVYVCSDWDAYDQKPMCHHLAPGELLPQE